MVKTRSEQWYMLQAEKGRIGAGLKLIAEHRHYGAHYLQRTDLLVAAAVFQEITPAQLLRAKRAAKKEAQ